YFQIELRPLLTFSDGTPLNGQDVVRSILRSQSASSLLAELGKPTSSRSQPLLIRVPKIQSSSLSATDLAVLLSSPRTAILPEKFSATSPIGCGALKAKLINGRLTLTRNDRAPRGGSFLETIEMRSVSITDALRAFESRSADVGFLGRGLHQPRK